MKFFTKEWWEAGCESADAIFAKYEAYLASVRAQLPRGLVALEGEHTLHDSEVKSIRSTFDSKTVTMVLDGWDRELKFPVRYTLEFSRVFEFDQAFPAQDYVEQELGDLGYWECELVSSGVEVRMLFVSSAEFRIVFGGFSFQHERRVV